MCKVIIKETKTGVVLCEKKMDEHKGQAFVDMFNKWTNDDVTAELKTKTETKKKRITKKVENK